LGLIAAAEVEAEEKVRSYAAALKERVEAVYNGGGSTASKPKRVSNHADVDDTFDGEAGNLRTMISCVRRGLFL
jgi:hypothetical protein